MKDDPKTSRDESKSGNTRDDVPSNDRGETVPHGFWNQTKTWAAKNRTISGALVGGAAGTILPGVGLLIGAIVGAGVGFASSKERIGQVERQDQPETTRGRRGE
jgi:hypothetical protein